MTTNPPNGGEAFASSPDAFSQALNILKDANSLGTENKEKLKLFGDLFEIITIVNSNLSAQIVGYNRTVQQS